VVEVGGKQFLIFTTQPDSGMPHRVLVDPSRVVSYGIYD
jgi:hypothetical protein